MAEKYTINTYRDENGDPVDFSGLVHELSVTTANFVSVGDSSFNQPYSIGPGGCVDNTIIGTGIRGTSGCCRGAPGGATDPIFQTAKPVCDHVMGDETETEDGQVVGHCTLCGDKIKGRRMVGGYGLARLKDAIVDALGDREAMAGLLEEIDRVELMLRVEEQALRSAHDMLDMAREMVEKIVLPDEPTEEAA